MFYTKIKPILENIPNLANFLKDIHLSSSYLGVRYFLNGRQAKMGERGVENMLDATGHRMYLVPVIPGSEEEVLANQLQDKFMEDFKEYLKKFENDVQRTTITKDVEAPVIEKELAELDTAAPVVVDGVELDLGFDKDDLF